MYNIPDETVEEVTTEVVLGENDIDVKFTPSEGGAIFTRVLSNIGAIPEIYKVAFDGQGAVDQLLFSEAFMPDWR